MRFSSFTYLVGQGLHNLKANKMMTLASMGVLIVCMILVGAAFLFGANIDSMVAYIGEQNETVAFINDDADTAAVRKPSAAFRMWPGWSSSPKTRCWTSTASAWKATPT